MRRTQVAIIGGGPAGILLSHLLHRHDIDSVVLERQTKAYVLKRIRAGVLEYGSVKLLRDSGAGERMDREGHAHDGELDRLAGPRAVSHRHQDLCRQADVVARADRDHRGTVPDPGARRRTHRRRGGECPPPRPDHRRAEGDLRQGRRDRDARMRLHRRLRRLPRRVAAEHSEGDAQDLRARLSVRLARNHVGNAAGRGRHLRPARARLRSRLAAQSEASAATTSSAASIPRSPTGPTTGSGTS